MMKKYAWRSSHSPDRDASADSALKNYEIAEAIAK
jgi:hypothetical protein